MVLGRELAVGVLASLSLAAALSVPEAQGIQPRNIPCPDPKPILPCTCESDSYYFSRLDCSLVNTNDELERVFSTSFPFKEFLEFLIDHNPNDPVNNLTELHAGIFGDLTFERVIIKGTKIKKIEESVFSKSHETLNLLNLENNEINEFPFESVGLYTRLETLLLSNNELPALHIFSSSVLKTLSVGSNSNLNFESDVLEGIPSLKNLIMNNIGTTLLPPHMFRNLTGVETINFDDNPIQVLDEFTINPIGKTVKRLMFSGNRLFTMLNKAISGLRDDAIVDMRDNDITELTEDIWRPLFDQVPGGMIDLKGNPLRCGCDMAWLFLGDNFDYLQLVSEATTCHDNTQVWGLDPHVFQIHCTSIP